MKVKMSQILINADQSLQTTGSYTRHWDEETKTAKQYCAIGMIACTTKTIGQYGYVGSEYMMFEKLKIPKKFRNMWITCKLCEKVKLKDARRGFSQENNYVGKLPSYIIHLNDDHEWTFLQIGEYLKELGL